MLSNDITKEILTTTIDQACLDLKVELLAWVIMPEHVHLVLIPPESVKLGPLVGRIKRLSAESILRLLRESRSPLLQRLTMQKNGQLVPSLWYPRCFDRNCRCEREVREKIDYCHMNPVRRGYVKCPEDWRWSSYRQYLENG